MPARTRYERRQPASRRKVVLFAYGMPRAKVLAGSESPIFFDVLESEDNECARSLPRCRRACRCPAADHMRLRTHIRPPLFSWRYRSPPMRLCAGVPPPAMAQVFRGRYVPVWRDMCIGAKRRAKKDREVRLQRYRRRHARQGSQARQHIDGRHTCCCPMEASGVAMRFQPCPILKTSTNTARRHKCCGSGRVRGAREQVHCR